MKVTIVPEELLLWEYAQYTPKEHICTIQISWVTDLHDTRAEPAKNILQ